MILVTGGAGYIGSHCVIELLKQGLEVLVVDNLSCGHIETIDRLKKYKNFIFINADLTNKNQVDEVFKSYKIDAVFHFASFALVEESMNNPIKYYNNNIIGGINLLNSMVENNVNKIIFSSSAAVYGKNQYVPIDENHPKKPVNPYGKTKLIFEMILEDYARSYGIKYVILRYFNVIGANPDSVTGEWHNVETHLLPNILKNVKNHKKIQVFGNNYDTKDGTCVRDYVNVNDLIDGHIKALEYLNTNSESTVINLGSDKGYSVKEIIDECGKYFGKSLEYDINEPRKGDPATLIADNNKAKTVLNWNNKTPLKESIRQAFDWEAKMENIRRNV